MKSIYKSFLLIFFFLICSNSSANNIAFIDLDAVFKKTNSGKKIIDKFENRRNQELKEIKKKENDIKSFEIEIRNKKNIISEDELKLEISKLQKNIKEFNLFKNETQNDFKKSKNDEIMNFFNKIDPIIQTYLDENSIDILFNNKNIIIGKDSLDITNNIIKIVNMNLK